MPDLSSVINHPLLYVIAIVIVLFVIVQSVVFGRRAWRQGLAMGMDKKTMVQAIRSSAIFSIVPSIPILIALVTMIKSLGIPLPWIRLSIIGSASYELVAADLAAKGMGLAGGLTDPGFNAVSYSTAAWVMTIGITGGLICSIFLMKRVQTGVAKIQSKDRGWGTIMMASLFMGMVCAFLGQGISAGWVSILTIASAALIMFGLETLAKRPKLRWVSQFSLSVSMVCAMALAIVYDGLIGG
jgi:hypothetical protein